MNQSYKYAIEEESITLNDIGISPSFFNKILNSEIKLIEKKSNNLFKFIYVGVIAHENEILLILPKYYRYNNPYYNSKLSCITEIISVLKKLPKKIVLKNKDTLIISKDLDDEYISEVAIADFLIKDYIKHGYYTKSNMISKLNSDGKTDWKNTINKVSPIFSNGSPIYTDTYNTKTYDNTDNLILKIHKCLVKYSIAKYSELLGYRLKISNSKKITKDLNNLGNHKTISNLIRQELYSTYNDREILLLKCMYNFFNKSNHQSNNGLALFGTTSFKFIWEYVSGYIFKNQYKEFSKYIEQPKWKTLTGKETTNDKNILKPDIIRLINDTFMIVDAKYYSIDLKEDSISKNPGTYDIVKQYTYEIALRSVFKNQNFINILLYPKDMQEEFSLFGQVKMDIFQLGSILNVYLSPKALWNYYLKQQRLCESQLTEIINFRNQL